MTTKTFKVEVLGKVPSGLTHNDVFATFNSVVREGRFPNVHVQSVTKRRLAGGMISLIAHLDSPDWVNACAAARYAGHSVTGFSFDMTHREVRG